MEKDFDVSLKRSANAKKGGGNPKIKKDLFKQTFKQTDKQNPEYENENIDDIDNTLNNNGKGEKIEFDFSKSSNEFKEYFLNDFIKAPKQKKKTKELLYKILIDLQSYDEPFAIGLMKNAVLNNWQGYKFDKTDEQYSDYLRKKQNGNNSQWANGPVDGVQRPSGKQPYVFSGAEFSAKMQERLKNQGIID